MGATDCSFTVKGKDREALTKNFWKTVKQAKHERGHGGYTGSAAEFSQIVWTTKVFNLYEDMQAFITNLNDKDVAYMVQMKVFKDSPTIERWLKEARELNQMVWRSNDEKFKAQTKKTIEKLYAKIKAARLRKAEASKKTEWVACGWVSE